MRIAPRPHPGRLGRAEESNDITAVMVERNDGTCTVLWAGMWRAFSSRSEWWPTRRDAMHAVERVTGDILIWSEMAPRTWTARAA